jgi:hypothetical protein
MKSLSVLVLTLCALGLAAAPLAAEKVYVPVTGSHDVELRISNYDLTERPYSASFLGAGVGRGLQDVVPADRAVLLEKVAPAGETGLVELEAAPELLVDAWVQSTSRRGVTYITGVPVIRGANQVAAGGTALLNRLGPGVAGLALVNLGSQAASCQVEPVRVDGFAAGASAAFEVAATSLRRIEGAPDPEAVAAKVSCDQPFYAYATAVDGETSEVSFVIPSPAGEAIAAPEASRSQKAPLPAGTVVFSQDGFFHSPARGNDKGVLHIPVPRELALSRITIDWDVTVGPWSKRKPDGSHAMLWLHRGKFRSNTVANVNAWGMEKRFIKVNQNLDLPPRKNTNTSVKLGVEQGRTYHVRYVYNALNKTIDVAFSEGGELRQTGRLPGTVKNHTLKIPKSGLVAELGHYSTQHPPEVETWGWSYGNLRIEMIPKNAGSGTR